MPTYDYECAKCGHTFDAFQSMSDDPLKKCPNCGRNSLKRLIGGGLGVIFKGSGFYVTDSRDGSKAATSTAAKTSEPASDSKSDSKTAPASGASTKSDSSSSSTSATPAKESAKTTG